MDGSHIFLAWPSRVYGHQEAFRGNLQSTGILENIRMKVSGLFGGKLLRRWSRDSTGVRNEISPPGESWLCVYLF